MVQRPAGMGAFEFVILAARRSAQLMRHCTPRVDGAYKTITIAQLEVATGKVARAHEVVQTVPPGPEPDSIASDSILVPVAGLVPETDVIASVSRT